MVLGLVSGCCSVAWWLCSFVFLWVRLWDLHLVLWVCCCGVTVAFGAFFGGVLLIRLLVGLDDLPLNACLIADACLVGLFIAVTTSAMCLVVNNVGVWFFIFFLV